MATVQRNRVPFICEIMLFIWYQMGKCVEFGSVVVFKSGKFEGEVFMHMCVERERA